MDGATNASGCCSAGCQTPRHSSETVNLPSEAKSESESASVESESGAMLQGSTVTDSDNSCIFGSRHKHDTPKTNCGQIGPLFHSFNALKGKPTSQWNDIAHIVYAAFKVKRYKVDLDYILCPSIDPTSEEHEPSTGRIDLYCGSTVSQILDLCDEPDQMIGRSKSWLEFQPKMQRLLTVFDGDAHLLLQGLHDVSVFQCAKQSLETNIKYLTENPDKSLDSAFRENELQFFNYLKIFLRDIWRFAAKKRDLHETFFEAYFQYLMELFRTVSDVGIKTWKGFMHHEFELAMPSLGVVYIPRPDFFITDRRLNTLAVVKVKRASKRLELVSPEVSSPGDADAEDVKVLEEGCEAISLDENDVLGDTFDAQECQMEERMNVVFPKHLSHLHMNEKRQVRCFLPQLFGQLLACTAMKEQRIPLLQTPYETHLVGIGVVGLQVRFVTLVVKDSRREILEPTAADIEKHPSVKPFLYVTEALNLCKKEHIAIFFRTLFALRSLGNFV